MRRSDREIREFEEIVAVMKKCRVCRLALFDAEYPYLIPLNFGMKTEGQQITLYFHGAREGTKYRLMEQNPHAAFEMDCSHRVLVPDDPREGCGWGMAYESVVGQGILEPVPEEEKETALRALLQQFGREDCRFDPRVVANTRVMKLTVVSCTGKRRSAP